MSSEEIRLVYDRVASVYADKFDRELDGKPLDRALLDAFAELVRGRGRVLDVGCGTGHIGAYLADRGADVEGVDISPAMIERARALHPNVRFRVGDMLALDDGDGAIAGISAAYAIVHLLPEDVARAAAEWRRVLAPGGWLLVSFHVGNERFHLDEFIGEKVAVDYTFHERAAVEADLERAGLEVEARLERKGDAAVEHPSFRAYLLARRRPT
jgi:SAM-dependent methyltransferase